MGENDEEVKAEETQSVEQLQPPSSDDEWIDLLDSGVILKKVLKKSDTDRKPEKQQTCRLNYECELEDGTVVETVTDYEVEYGDSDVVNGLDLSLGLMHVGETCRLKIQPRLAFGTKGLPPLIPPDAVVIYTVELLSAEFVEIEDLNIEQRQKKGNKKKERGNWWYGRGENRIAIQCYRKALEYLDEVEGGIKFDVSEKCELDDTKLQNLLEDRISVYNNIAAAQIKLEQYDQALTSLQTVLRCQPNNIKALFRQAKVHKAKNNISQALKSLQKASENAPDDNDVKSELAKLKVIVEKHKKSERELAKRMFADSFKNNKEEKKKNKTFLWVTLACSVIAGALGMATYRYKFS